MHTDSLFFRVVADRANLKKSNCQLILLTHLIPNVPELLEAFSNLIDIKLILAIPYSIDQKTMESTVAGYPVVFPSLDDLFNANLLLDLIKQHVDKTKPFVIQEIGGYFSEITHELKALYGDQFLGIIEDTEAGHKRYLAVEQSLACPVVSVARSELKVAEDFLIGDSCLRASLYLINKNNFNYLNKKALVMGFGKIGRATAYAAKKFGFSVCVYDIDPIKELMAYSEGFEVGKRECLIAESDYIFGASANFSIQIMADKEHLKDGTKLISCSSKQLEFNTEGCVLIQYIDHIDRIAVSDKTFFLFAKGQPINFIGDFLIGAMIRVVHAEILLALDYLIHTPIQPSLITISYEQKCLLAQIWLEHFVSYRS